MFRLNILYLLLLQPLPPPSPPTPYTIQDTRLMYNTVMLAPQIQLPTTLLLETVQVRTPAWHLLA